MVAAHKEMTRRQILDAARDNFLEFGYPAVALGDIAMDAGIGRTTVSLPLSPALTDEDVEDVIDAVRRTLGRSTA